MIRSLVFSALVLLLFLAPPASADGAFSHATFNDVVSRFVDAQGRVDYKGIVADHAALDTYLAAVAADSPTSNAAKFPTKNDRLAYYINAYNAFSIKGVTNRPGIKSVQAVTLDFFALTRWTMGGSGVTLKVLEDDIRRDFKDPRVHMALNCQSGGCPRLPQQAFDPAKLDAQLDAAAHEFCTNPAKVYADAQGVWHISQIFEWYEKDFEASGGRVAFIDAHGGTIPSDAKVQIIPYDWTLAAQPGRAP